MSRMGTRLPATDIYGENNAKRDIIAYASQNDTSGSHWFYLNILYAIYSADVHMNSDYLILLR